MMENDDKLIKNFMLAYKHEIEDNGFIIVFHHNHSVLRKLSILFFLDRKSTRLNSSHIEESRMPSSA